VTLICDLLIPNHNKKQCIINVQYMKIFNGITGFHLIVVTDKDIHTNMHTAVTTLPNWQFMTSIGYNKKE